MEKELIRENKNITVNNDTIGLTVGAIAGGLIATGGLVALIPVIGTGVGAAAITSGISVLGGGSIASGGFGMIGGLSVFGSVTTISTGIGAFVGNIIGSKSEESISIENLKKNYPTVTHDYNICDVDELLERYNKFISNTHNIYTGDVPILIHINNYYPFVGSTIILSPSKLVEINKNEIISQCYIKDILRIKAIYGSSFLEWDNINVITKQGKEIVFYVKHRNILHKIVDFVKKHLINII